MNETVPYDQDSPKQKLLDRLSVVGAKGISQTEANRIAPPATVQALIRKGVVVVRPVGEKGALRAYLSAKAPIQ